MTDDPQKMGSLVRDKDGDLWRRGRTRWTCQTPVDGIRVHRVGRLPWHALTRMYGPLTVVRVGKADSLTMRTLTPSQEQVLGYVADQGPVSAADTATSMMMSNASARSRLDTLERRGLLTIQHTGHGRARTYLATDAGKALAAEVFADSDTDSDEPLPVRIVAYPGDRFTRITDGTVSRTVRDLTYDDLFPDEQTAVDAARVAATLGHITVIPGKSMGVVQEWWK